MPFEPKSSWIWRSCVHVKYCENMNKRIKSIFTSKAYSNDLFKEFTYMLPLDFLFVSCVVVQIKDFCLCCFSSVVLLKYHFEDNRKLKYLFTCIISASWMRKSAIVIILFTVILAPIIVGLLVWEVENQTIIGYKLESNDTLNLHFTLVGRWNGGEPSNTDMQGTSQDIYR